MKKKWLIIFSVLVVLLPIILNWLITRPAFFNFVGDGTDWLGFWVTYISAIASFAMVVITWMTLKQNENQLNEMKAQWEAERNPNLVLSLGIAQKALFLKVANVGMMPAYNVSLSINEDFYNQLPSHAAKDCFDKFIEPFYIDGKSTKYVYIGFGDDLESCLKDQHITLEVEGTYCDNIPIRFTCNMDEIIGKKFARVVDELTLAMEGIEKGVSSSKSAFPYNTIQKSLHIIADTMVKSSKEEAPKKNEIKSI